jgi:hypothetical protein
LLNTHQSGLPSQKKRAQLSNTKQNGKFPMAEYMDKICCNNLSKEQETNENKTEKYIAMLPN